LKKLAVLFLCTLFLYGCHADNTAINYALSLRNQIIAAERCTFDCKITADYSDRLYTFSMNCCFDKNGSMTFSVNEPESISGITGTVDSQGGKLTFDDQALFFQLLADGYISPVSAPWLFMKTLRSGYIDSSTNNGNGLYISIDDSFEENPLTIEVWTDQQNNPIRAEMLWNGRRVLSLDVSNFSCL